MILFTTLSTRQLLPVQGYVLFAFITWRSYAESNAGLGEAKIIPAQHMIQVIVRENDTLLMTMSHETYSRNKTQVYLVHIDKNLAACMQKLLLQWAKISRPAPLEEPTYGGGQ